MKIVTFFLLAIVGMVLLPSYISSSNPKELGKVEWIRDFDVATELAAESKKPILILFQEVPGCMTCQRYGNVVLSHPLIVETIETYFVPLAIHNNKGGKDQSVLKLYHEPSWNNPVVRMVGADKRDILPRLNANYTPSGLVSYMIDGLTKLDQDVPIVFGAIKRRTCCPSKGTLRRRL